MKKWISQSECVRRLKAEGIPCTQKTISVWGRDKIIPSKDGKVRYEDVKKECLKRHEEKESKKDLECQVISAKLHGIKLDNERKMLEAQTVNSTLVNADEFRSGIRDFIAIAKRQIDMISDRYGHSPDLYDSIREEVDRYWHDLRNIIHDTHEPFLRKNEIDIPWAAEKIAAEMHTFYTWLNVDRTLNEWIDFCREYGTYAKIDSRLLEEINSGRKLSNASTDQAGNYCEPQPIVKQINWAEWQGMKDIFRRVQITKEKYLTTKQTQEGAGDGGLS